MIDTDEVARAVVAPGEPVLGQIREIFGSHMVTPEGELQRAALAQVVFSSAEARQTLEALLHPLIRRRWLDQLAIWREEDRKVAVVVIPLLFETQAQCEFDRILCLACSLATQRERLRARGWSDSQLDQRIAAQLPIEDKILRSHHVIWTEGGLDVHADQLERVFPVGV